jgi:hypothetical protein
VLKLLDGFVERTKKRGFEAGSDRSTHLGMSSAGTSLSGKLSLARPHKIIDYSGGNLLTKYINRPIK